MHAPGITRHRRPFLAPLWVSLLAALVFVGIVWTFYRGVTTTVIVLVRPVEKEPGTIEDPPVSPEGEAQAQRLAQMFGAASGPGGLDAIYESDDHRAQQTVAPLAERLHRAPTVFQSNAIKAAAARILREHDGGTVLVVASGTALPLMARELTGIDPGRLSSDPNTFFVISLPTFGRAHLVRLSF